MSNLKFSIFVKIKNLTENQNSATVVYHNFANLTKFENQNFLKLIRTWPYKCDKPFSKIFKSIWTKIRQIHKNLAKLAPITKILKKILKTFLLVSASWMASWVSPSWFISNLEPTKFVILRIFWTKFGDFVKIWILANLWNLKSLTLAKIKILDP